MEKNRFLCPNVKQPEALADVDEDDYHNDKDNNKFLNRIFLIFYYVHNAKKQFVINYVYDSFYKHTHTHARKNRILLFKISDEFSMNRKFENVYVNFGSLFVSYVRS